MVYLDDIMSFGSDFDSALDNLVMNCEGLRDYDLQLKANNHKYSVYLGKMFLFTSILADIKHISP